MAVQDAQSYTKLPNSHYFLTVSRGSGMRTFAIRWFVVHAALVLLPILGLAGSGSIAYIVFHDDLVAALMNRQSQMQYAYEDKLVALRGQLQHEANRQLTDQEVVERSVQDLLSREAKLETRTAWVTGLAGQVANRSGTETASSGPAPARRPANPLGQLQPAGPGLPDGVMSFAPEPVPALTPPAVPKPHPEAMLVEPSRGLPGGLEAALPIKTRLSLLSASLDRVEQGQVGAVYRLGGLARAESERLRGAIEDAGLSPERFKTGRLPATGGPFVPLPDDKDSPFARAIETLQTSQQSVERLRGVIGHVPLAGPLPGSPEVTSPFGARIDPFLGRPALHTGVDLKQEYGAEVRTTAAGRVSFAGQMGGYGNMVEVDHGNGLASRYAHLSRIDVAEGETVSKGSVLGEVGSTGRATGPHLHYEVRIDGEPVDPMRFLDVGLRLAKAETHL